MSAMSGMIIPDDDVNVGEVFFDGSFQVCQPDRLETHVGIVKIADRRLNQKEFQNHSPTIKSCARGKSPIYLALSVLTKEGIRTC